MARSKRKRAALDYYDQAQELIDEAAARDELYDRLDEIYDQTRLDEARSEAENVQLVQMPYGTNAVDLVADLAAQMDMTIVVPAAKETATAKREADDIESWLHAWHSLNEQVQHRNLTADAAWFGAMRAQVVLRTLFLDSLLEKDGDGYTIKRVPIILQARDPRYVYVDEGPAGPDCVVEAYKRTARAIRHNYPDALKDRDEYPDESLIEWVEVWTEKERIYFAGGAPVKVGGLEVVPHRYGCIPYAFGTARTTPRHRPGQRYRPLLAGVEDTLTTIDTWFSILTTAGYDSVTNSWAVFSDSYGPEGKSLDLGPDSVNYFAAQDKVQPLQRAPLPPDFFQLGSMLIESFQHGTFPFAMYGQLPGQLAGYAINMLTQSGRRPLVPIWEAVQRAYEGAFRNAVIIAREVVAPLVGDEIPLLVWGASTRDDMGGKLIRRALTLDVAKIGDDFDVQVELSDPLPSDEAQALRMAIEATKSGLLSKQTALELYKIVEDALAEGDRVKAEAVVDQLAQIEGIKLAIERGYIPPQIRLPAGWHAMPDGRLMPDVLMPRPEPQPTPQPAPTQPQSMMPGAAEMQAMAPMGQMMPDMAQMAGEAPPLPEELLAVG